MKKALAAVLCIMMLIPLMGFKDPIYGEDRGYISTMEYVKNLGIGINLGNTFEACGSWINPGSVKNYETAWGSPVITEEIIKGYAESGFGVIRVPVAWSNMMGKDYSISEEYLERVQEVVGWILKYDMCAIMNIHWDGGWFEGFADSGRRAECFKKYEAVWTQLCDAFKDYSDMLMFESLNEEGGWDSIWNRYTNQGDKALSFGILNDINQTFVDIVRKSGGKNEYRHLLIAGYNTDVSLTCDSYYKMPEDPRNRCAVSVHYYTPATFAILDKDADWGKARTEWGTKEDYAELNGYMDMLEDTFVNKGIPVIIGEYACCGNNKTKEMADLYNTSVCAAAIERDICPVLWDVQHDNGKDSFYDRRTHTVSRPEALAKMLEAYEKRVKERRLSDILSHIKGVKRLSGRLFDESDVFERDSIIDIRDYNLSFWLNEGMTERFYHLAAY